MRASSSTSRTPIPPTHFNNAGDEISFARYRRIPAIFEIHSLPFDAADPQLAEPAAVLPAGDPQWSDYLYETHGYTPDDRYLVFTGHSDATEANNDILIVEPECRRLVDQVTASVDVWDEHAHFQPGFDRLLWSSQQDTPKPGIGLFSRADWWVRESDGTKHRLTRFNEEDWPLRAATLTQDGSAIQIKSTNLFAADGEFSPDGNTFAGVLLFRDWGLDEWIVLVDLEEVDPE